MVQVGDAVQFVDPVRNVVPALVTAVWSETCINLVYVSLDDARRDQYGRQIERHTSVCHVSGNQAGNCWKKCDELLPERPAGQF